MVHLALRMTTEKSGEFPIWNVDAFMEGKFQPKSRKENNRWNYLGNLVPEIKQKDKFAPISFLSDLHLWIPWLESPSA